MEKSRNLLVLLVLVPLAGCVDQAKHREDPGPELALVHPAFAEHRTDSEFPPCNSTPVLKPKPRCYGAFRFQYSTYEGEWRRGYPHGRGIYVYDDGEIYVGDIRGSYKRGKGLYKFANGDEYEGEFKDNFLHGEGVYTYANGNRYVGEFRFNDRHGQGRLVYADGKVEEGLWENGKLVRVK